MIIYGLKRLVGIRRWSPVSIPSVSAAWRICSQVAPQYCKIEATSDAQFEPLSVFLGS
jgi:hypothetical protein